jgi:hypothetical protein
MEGEPLESELLGPEQGVEQVRQQDGGDDEQDEVGGHERPTSAQRRAAPRAYAQAAANPARMSST